MTDPTAMALTGGFAAALAVFLAASVWRAWCGWKRRRGLEVGGPPAPPVGKVPVWFYRPLDLMGVALVFAVFSGLVLASVRVSGTGEPSLNPGTLAVSIGFQFVMAGVVVLLVARRVSLVSWLGLRWPAWPWVLLLAPGAVCFMWIIFGGLQVAGYVKWMESLGVETVQDTVKLLQESKDPLMLGLMACAAVIAAPLCEEVVFRGYFYPVMKKFAGMPAAVLCSALVFATAHGNLTALLPLFIFGCVLVFLYEKTGSLWAPIAAHFCFNGATVIIQMAVRYYDIPLEMPQ